METKQPVSLQTWPASQRGIANLGWLDSRHSFSFGHYHDPARMGFRSLRVINDDRVAGGKGFGTHPHQDMEIFSYVLSGSLAHRDSTGTESTLRYGDIQAMSAGSGVHHSEFNPSSTEATHFLQIWIEPDTKGVEPRYGEISVPESEKLNQLRLIVTGKNHVGALQIHQDADVFASILDPHAQVLHEARDGRGTYLQIATGSVLANGLPLGEGDAAFTEDAGTLEIVGVDRAEFLLFDLS